MNIENKTIVKLGDWSLDVAKYVITGVIITSFLGLLGENTWLLYLVSIVCFVFFLFLGIWLINKDKEK